MRTLLICLLLTAATAAFAADTPGVPSGFQWMVVPCETWNCASSALILANGDPYVLTMPVKSDQFKWIILRRVVSGSFYIPPDAPFTLETFDQLADGSARFTAIDSAQSPLLLTAPDAKSIVVYLSHPPGKTRAVTH